MSLNNMFSGFKWGHSSFRNLLALLVIVLCFWYMHTHPNATGEMLILLTLVIKFFFGDTSSAVKKDDTINSLSNSIPDATTKN